MLSSEFKRKLKLSQCLSIVDDVTLSGAPPNMFICPLQVDYIILRWNIIESIFLPLLAGDNLGLSELLLIYGIIILKIN